MPVVMAALRRSGLTDPSPLSATNSYFSSLRAIFIFIFLFLQTLHDCDAQELMIHFSDILDCFDRFYSLNWNRLLQIFSFCFLLHTLMAGTPAIAPCFSSSGESLSGLHLFHPRAHFTTPFSLLSLLHLLFLLLLVLLQAFPTRHSLNSSWETNEDGCEAATDAEGDGGASAHLFCGTATPPSLKIILSWTSGETKEAVFVCLFVYLCFLQCSLPCCTAGGTPSHARWFGHISRCSWFCVFLLSVPEGNFKGKVRFHKFVSRNLNRQVQTFATSLLGKLI